MTNVITVFTVSFAFALGFAWLVGASHGEASAVVDIVANAGQYSIR